MHRHLQPPVSGVQKVRRLLLVALLMALLTAVATHSSPPSYDDAFGAALDAATVRLVNLQASDGTWPQGVAGKGDLSAVGGPARAVLAAHLARGDQRALAASGRAARRLSEALDHVPAAATTTNLLFLAEHALATGDDALLERVRQRWQRRLVASRTAEPAAAAAELSARPNRTAWDDGAWRNFLLWQAGEVADLARRVGDRAWADEFTLAMASSWAPKRHHAWCALGAGRMLDALSRVRGDEARRLAAAERGTLRDDELAPGLPWSDTPHDTWVHVPEVAVAARGLLASADVDDRRAARDALFVLVQRQATTGGWATTVSLFEHPLEPGSQEFVPDARLGIAESAQANADVILALTRALGPAGRGSQLLDLRRAPSAS